ncbi:MAG: hypothetical protein R3Y05_02515 [bacterium]
MSETYKQSRLTMFAYILLKREIEFDSYIEQYVVRRIHYNTNIRKRTDRELFNYLLHDIHTLIKELKLNCNHISYKEKNKKTHYYIISKQRIKLNINKIPIKIRKKYIYEIIYIYLINNKYINLKVLNDLFGTIKKDMFYQIRKELEPILNGELKLNRKSGTYEFNIYK